MSMARRAVRREIILGLGHTIVALLKLVYPSRCGHCLPVAQADLFATFVSVQKLIAASKLITALTNLFRVFPMAVFRFTYSPAIGTVPEVTLTCRQLKADYRTIPNNIVDAVLIGLPMLTADKVLVTIGTPCSMSAVGGAETYKARVRGAPEFIAYAAFDAGLVDIDLQGGSSLRLQWATGDRAGQAATIEEIESLHGAQLRQNLGIRRIPEISDIGRAHV